ncbi:DNA-formamidopyrimidine glycosylase, partial [Patescibacteria group bacterium]|nr:DNA-formamidopyrimidine glycosylase [Patescibacteria group bacterium]
MPELPEVETIRMGLQKYLVGHEILDIKVHNKIFQGDKRNVIGAKIESVKRVGKGLIVSFNNNYALAIHIKLTGQLIYRGSETK